MRRRRDRSLHRLLRRSGIDVIVIERTEVAAASGKAGGFLALDWCAGTRSMSWRAEPGHQVVCMAGYGGISMH